MAWGRGLVRGRSGGFASLGFVASFGAMVPAISGAGPKAGASNAATGKTIGLTLTGWRYAFVETPQYTECGAKLDPGPVGQLRATPGALERIMTEGGSFEQTGPNGESPQNSPLVFHDPLPTPELVTKTGFGVNLDGTGDGHATPKTCKHEKLTSA